MGRVEAIAAVRSNPKDAQAWARLGTLLAEAGEKEKATECFLRALRIDGDLIEARTGLEAVQGVRLRADTLRKVEEDDRDTRKWSPMTHVLLAYNKLTLDEARALEADYAFGASASVVTPSRMGWLFTSFFPLLLWGLLYLLYTQTSLHTTLPNATLAARTLALTSVIIAIVTLLGVSTYAAQFSGWLGKILTLFSWIVWLLSLGSLLF